MLLVRHRPFLLFMTRATEYVASQLFISKIVVIGIAIA